MSVWRFLPSFVAVFLGASGIASAQDKPLLCDQQFALCTSAPCIPAPRQSEGGALYLRCVGLHGCTHGCVACGTPSEAEHRRQWQRTVYSYFSLVQSYQGKR